VLDDSNVIYLRPVGGQSAELVAADPRTGREAWHSRPALFTSWPAVCADRTTAVCVTGGPTSQASAAELMIFDAATGTSAATIPISSPGKLGRETGDGVFDPGRRNPELFVAVTGSSIAWTRPLRDMFTLPGASTGFGWNLTA
jgi:outer membrane protein assembly factor BamB